MKKVIVFLLIFMLSISVANPVLATGMEEKLGDHWSKEMIDRDFLLYYFPYLAKENFNRLSLNEAIYEDEFLLSFSSLLKENGYSTAEIGWRTTISRIEMVAVVGEKLLEIRTIESDTEDMPFTDIDEITEEQREVLANLYDEGIISGQSRTKFNPYADTTQAEAIVVLQRVNSLLNDLNSEEEPEDQEEPEESEKPEDPEEEPEEVSFNLSGIVQSYSGKEGINTKIEVDKVLVSATKMFPTPGYTVEVERIMDDNGEYKIYLDITPPSEDSIQPQVITYKTITVVIDKEDLGESPYNFVWGDFMV